MSVENANDDDRIERIRRRLCLATPGTWRWERSSDDPASILLRSDAIDPDDERPLGDLDHFVVEGVVRFESERRTVTILRTRDEDWGANADANRAFIEIAPTLVAKLLERIDRAPSYPSIDESRWPALIAASDLLEEQGYEATADAFRKLAHIGSVVTRTFFDHREPNGAWIGNPFQLSPRGIRDLIGPLAETTPGHWHWAVLFDDTPLSLVICPPEYDDIRSEDRWSLYLRHDPRPTSVLLQVRSFEDWSLENRWNDQAFIAHARSDVFWLIETLCDVHLPVASEAPEGSEFARAARTLATEGFVLESNLLRDLARDGFAFEPHAARKIDAWTRGRGANVSEPGCATIGLIPKDERALRLFLQTRGCHRRSRGRDAVLRSFPFSSSVPNAKMVRTLR